MRQHVPVPNPRRINLPSPTMILDWFSRQVDAALNQIFSLTHSFSVLRWRALFVGSFLAWLFFGWLVFQDLRGSREMQILMAFLREVLGISESQVLTINVAGYIAVTLFHQTVWQYMLALIAPFWMMRNLAARYLADIFEESEETGQKFIMQAAFGRGYSTLHISRGAVAEEDRNSTIIKIGGPGYVQVDLDSAVLFERPDGTPHVIGPTKWEIIDDFERIRRVIDLRDNINALDLPLTRSRDGIIVRAKDVQFSYSVYRGEGQDRAETPYPFSRRAIESLVYGDTRVVEPGVFPAPVPEWQLPFFGMNGPITAEISGFINRLRLSQFLAAIGEPEESSWQTRELQIGQVSQVFSGINETQAGESPFEARPFSTRMDLTGLFYDQNGFQSRMANRGFGLNWIGVGTWHTPAEIIPENHRDAWRISRDNYVRGNPRALRELQTEARLQEFLRLIQILPINRFFSGFDSAAEDDYQQFIDDFLAEYEEILQRAADLYMRGPLALDLRFSRLLEEAVRLFARVNRPVLPLYDMFLQSLAFFAANGYSVLDPEVETVLSQAGGLRGELELGLEPEDEELLNLAIQLYADLAIDRRILRVIATIGQIRFPHHDMDNNE
jgi:hypothetical protein